MSPGDSVKTRGLDAETALLANLPSIRVYLRYAGLRDGK